MLKAFDIDVHVYDFFNITAQKDDFTKYYMFSY